MNSEKKKSNPLKLNSAWKQRQSPTPYGKKNQIYYLTKRSNLWWNWLETGSIQTYPQPHLPILQFKTEKKDRIGKIIRTCQEQKLGFWYDTLQVLDL